METTNKIILGFILICLCSCGSLRAPIIQNFNDSICNYKYFYIEPTGDYTSIVNSTNPANIISGILLKNGFIRIYEVKPEQKHETMIVNFGETGRRDLNLGYAIEVTVQFISASKQRPICSCTAEGQGDFEPDDIRIAIQRALKPLFP